MLRSPCQIVLLIFQRIYLSVLFVYQGVGYYQGSLAQSHQHVGFFYLYSKINIIIIRIVTNTKFKGRAPTLIKTSKLWPSYK